MKVDLKTAMQLKPVGGGAQPFSPTAALERAGDPVQTRPTMFLLYRWNKPVIQILLQVAVKQGL